MAVGIGLPLPVGLPLSSGAPVEVAAVVGGAERLWYLARTPLNSDEAVVGLMAKAILSGHTDAFYWGQHYGGVEPYAVAAVFAVFGSSAMALRVVPVLLSVLAVVVLWRLALRLTASPARAAAVSVVFWAVPQSVVWNATLEYGFRGVTMVCGLGILLLVARITAKPRPGADVVVLGMVAGIGWWSSPEIVYFLVPAGLVLATWVVRSRLAPGSVLGWSGAAGLAAAAGALPWLWDNVGSGFPSLRLGSYYVPAGAPGYGDRLAIFVRDVVPLLLDLRTPSSGAWTVPVPLAIGLAGAASAAVVAAVVVELGSGVGHRVGFGASTGVGGSRPGAVQPAWGPALAVGVVAFPFLWAVVPGVWLWESGRYSVFLVPLVVLTVLCAAERTWPVGTAAERRAVSTAPRRSAAGPVRRHAARSGRSGRRVGSTVLGAAAVLGAATVLGVADAAQLTAVVDPPGVVVGHGFDPDVAAQNAAAALERAGVTTGFADYWVAFDLDFLSHGRLQIADAPPSPNRRPALLARVEALPADRQPWLFVRPGPVARAQYVDSVVLQGPGGLAEATFLADLHRLGVPYRVRQVGSVQVVTPQRRVRFAAVGLVAHRPAER